MLRHTCVGFCLILLVLPCEGALYLSQDHVGTQKMFRQEPICVSRHSSCTQTGTACCDGLECVPLNLNAQRCEKKGVTYAHLVPTPTLASTLAAPSGTYAGSKTVLGVKVAMTVDVDSATSLHFKLTGPANIDCPNQTYSLASNGAVTIPGSDACIKGSLSKHHISHLKVSYSAAKNTVTVKVNDGAFHARCTMQLAACACARYAT